jgi:hypothetical protein
MDKILKKLTGALYRTGTRILLGTDCQNGMTIPGFSIHQELQNLVEAGLTPYEAIRAGTADAAAFFGVDTFGAIAPGKRADLVLVAENPLKDVGNVKRIEGVMVRGKWLPKVELQLMLDNVVASFIPPENRFAEVPPLSTEDETLFSARYEIRYAEIPIGEERFVLEKLQDGRRRIQAQAITDPPYASLATMNMLSDDSGGCYSLQYSHETSTRKIKIDMVRSGEDLKVSGNLRNEKPLDLNERVPKNLSLGASMLSSLLPLLEKAKSLRVGETMEIKGKAIRVMEWWFLSSLVDETIVIKRAADTDVSTETGNIRVSVLELEFVSTSFPQMVKLFVNERGEPQEVHLTNQQGVLKYVRIE